LDKIKVVSGDISAEKLGLNQQEEDELIENVDIIIHSAAVIKFNEKLKDAVNCNLVATLRLLQLATRMKHLHVFNYMSTIHSHAYKFDLEEEHVPCGLDFMDIIKKTQELSDPELDKLEKEM